MKKNLIIISGITFALLIIAAGTYWGFTRDSNEETETVNTPTGNNLEINDQQPPFRLNISNLHPLSFGSYELWVIQDNQSTSLGRFNADQNGEFIKELEQLDLTLKEGDQLLVTIESNSSTNDQPSPSVLLSGKVGADLKAEVNLSLPIDFEQAEGQYLLGTPTNDPEAFETSGIWFVQVGGQAPSLKLPNAPQGWKYEGWIFQGLHRLSSGRFSQVDEADDFDGYSGEKPGPNYPGEDYLKDLPQDLLAPLNLVDGETQIIISLEPDQEGLDVSDDPNSNNNPQPYIIFFNALIAENAADHTLYPLNFTNINFPQGSFNVR